MADAPKPSISDESEPSPELLRARLGAVAVDWYRRFRACPDDEQARDMATLLQAIVHAQTKDPEDQEEGPEWLHKMGNAARIYLEDKADPEPHPKTNRPLLTRGLLSSSLVPDRTKALDDLRGMFVAPPEGQRTEFGEAIARLMARTWQPGDQEHLPRLAAAFVIRVRCWPVLAERWPKLRESWPEWKDEASPPAKIVEAVRAAFLKKLEGVSPDPEALVVAGLGALIDSRSVKDAFDYLNPRKGRKPSKHR